LIIAGTRISLSIQRSPSAKSLVIRAVCLPQFLQPCFLLRSQHIHHLGAFSLSGFPQLRPQSFCPLEAFGGQSSLPPLLVELAHFLPLGFVTFPVGLHDRARLLLLSVRQIELLQESRVTIRAARFPPGHRATASLLRWSCRAIRLRLLRKGNPGASRDNDYQG